MSGTTRTKPRNNDHIDSPVAWFVALEHARNVSDFELAAKAQYELKRLGVVVRFTKGKEARRA